MPRSLLAKHALLGSTRDFRSVLIEPAGRCYNVDVIRPKSLQEKRVGFFHEFDSPFSISQGELDSAEIKFFNENSLCMVFR